MLEEEGGDSRLGVAVDYRPVYGGGSTVTGQQGGVEVECSEPGHLPNHFGEHPERDDNEQVGLETLQFADKFRIFELDGLHKMQAMLLGVKFHRGFKHPVATAGRFVRHRDHSDYVETLLDEKVEALDGKFGCAEKHYSEIFFFHCSSLGIEVSGAACRSFGDSPGGLPQRIVGHGSCQRDFLLADRVYELYVTRHKGYGAVGIRALVAIFEVTLYRTAD